VARLLATGSLDTTFGTGGYVLYNPTDLDDGPRANSMVVLADGSVVVGGRVGWDAALHSGGYSTIARFSGSGSLQAVANRASEFMPHLALDGAGRLVAAGVAQGQAQQLFVTRYDLSSGAITTDTTFGTAGTTTINAPSGTSFTNGWAWIAVGPTDRIALTYVPGANGDVEVAALTATGTLDGGFGTHGFADPIDTGSTEFNPMAAFDDSDRLLVGGCAFGTSDSVDWIVARLLAN
jgi:hypothetical protein